MMPWWTERTDTGELLVFRAGQLVHKKWPDGSSVTFGAVPSFAYSSAEVTARRVIGIPVTTVDDVEAMREALAARRF